jgi:hypothetical protein
VTTSKYVFWHGVDAPRHWIWWQSAPDTDWTTGNVVLVDTGQVLGTPEAAGG